MSAKDKATARTSKRGRINEGRPTSYDASIIPAVTVIYELGGIDDDVARALSVARSTVDAWANTYPEFRDARKAVKDEADSAVQKALYQRATGYQAPDGTHVPAHPTACIFWLKNRRKEQWRERQEIEHTTQTTEMSPEESKQYLVRLAAQTPVQNPVIRRWLKDCLAAIPPLEGGD